MFFCMSFLLLECVTSDPHAGNHLFNPCDSFVAKEGKKRGPKTTGKNCIWPALASSRESPATSRLARCFPRAPPSLPGRFTGRRYGSSPRNGWKLVPDPWSRLGVGWWPADGQLDEILVANWCCQQIRVFFFVLSFWSFCWILGVNLCWELV